MDDIFEKIVSGDIPSTKIYEDDTVLAFLDANPTNPGHTLVIPKEKFRNALETPDETLGKLMHVAKKIGNAMIDGLDADGVNIISNNEEAAGQVIFHTHLHVIPRYSDDGFKPFSQGEYKNENEKERVAEKLRNTLD